MEDGKVIIKGGRADGNGSGRQDMDEDSMNVLVSGVLHRDGKTFVRVSFVRGNDWAEGIVPDGLIEKSAGFSEEEIGKLQAYLAGEKEMILRQAKGVNPIRNLFQI